MRRRRHWSSSGLLASLPNAAAPMFICTLCEWLQPQERKGVEREGKRGTESKQKREREATEGEREEAEVELLP